MSTTPAKPQNPNTIYVLLYIVGGAFLGTGILNLYWSFGTGSHDLNADFAAVGFSAIDDISRLGNFQFAVPMIVGGLAMLIVANRNAWKETDGY